MNSHYRENLGLIERLFPDLYEKVLGVDEQDCLSLVQTPSGAYTLKAMTPDGGEIFVHSARDPLAEARKIGDALTGDYRMLVFLGCGLFYHILEILGKVPKIGPVLLVEKDPCMLHAAMKALALAPILQHHGTVFFLDKEPGEVEDFAAGNYSPEDLAGLRMVRLLPCLEMAPEYYREMEKRLQWQSDLADCKVQDPALAGHLEKYSGSDEMTWDRIAAELGRSSPLEGEASRILLLMKALGRE